jgi:hypothetical protein
MIIYIKVKFLSLTFLSSLVEYLRVRPGAYPRVEHPKVLRSGREYKLRGRLSAVDLLNEVACFVKMANNIFNVKKS